MRDLTCAREHAGSAQRARTTSSRARVRRNLRCTQRAPGRRCRHRLQANHRRCEGVNAGNRRRKVRGDRTDTAGWVRAHGHAQGPPCVAHSLQRAKFGPRATSSIRARRHLNIFEAKGVGEIGAFRFCLEVRHRYCVLGGDARDEHCSLSVVRSLKTFSGERFTSTGRAPPLCKLIFSHMRPINCGD